jgi:drug/metabolite transporter (DMT)-like permease
MSGPITCVSEPIAYASVPNACASVPKAFALVPNAAASEAIAVPSRAIAVVLGPNGAASRAIAVVLGLNGAASRPIAALLGPKADVLHASPLKRRGTLVVVAAAAFATASPLARLAIGISPIVVAMGRCAVASFVIGLVQPGEVFRGVRALSGRDRLTLAFAGLLLALHFALFLGGLASTSFPAAVTLISLEPLAVVVAARVAFGIAPSRAEAIGVAAATVGALVVATGSGTGEHRLLGDVMVLGAVALYGAYVMAARGLRDAMPVMPYAAAVYGVAAIALAPAALLFGLDAGTAPLSSWTAVVALGLVPTLIGHTLVQSAARRVSPAIVALVSPGETVGSLAIGAALLGAWPSVREAAGAALILAGAILAILRAPRAGVPVQADSPKPATR